MFFYQRTITRLVLQGHVKGKGKTRERVVYVYVHVYVCAWGGGEREIKYRKLTMSCLVYDLGNTSLAFAVLTSKSGMMARALISLAQSNRR